MDEGMVQYYENTATVCSYCLTGNTAQNWDGRAYCNAANHYSNFFLKKGIRALDLWTGIYKNRADNENQIRLF